MISFGGYTTRNGAVETQEYDDILHVPRHVCIDGDGLACLSEVL